MHSHVYRRLLQDIDQENLQIKVRVFLYQRSLVSHWLQLNKAPRIENSKSIFFRKYQLTRNGLSLRYGGSPSIISIAIIPKLPKNQSNKFSISKITNFLYLQISTLGPYCFLVTTSGAILHFNFENLARTNSFLVLPVRCSNHRLSFRLILSYLRTKSKIS